MKKNIKKPYFDDDINSRIKGMSDSDMNAALLSLEGTEHWIAILKYLQARSAFCQGVLVTTDPIKEPGKMCQTQGMLLGLSDLQSMVIMLKERAGVEENPGEE